MPAPFLLGKNSLVCTSLERVGHVVDSDDDPGPGTPCVYSVALVFAEAMGRFNVSAAANSLAAADSVSDQHAERTAVCPSATHGRVPHSF